jgi:hypothetical protein
MIPLAIFSFFYVMFFSNTAHAGGEISEEVIKTCENGTEAHSCLLLADDSKCGVGFNSTTSMYLHKACEIRKNKCKDKSVLDCYGYGVCLTGCIGIDPDNLSDSMWETGCWIDSTAETTEEKLIQSSIETLENTCNKKHAESCILAGEISLEIYKKDPQNTEMLNKAIHFFSQGCELNHTTSCAKLTVVYQTASKITLEKTCSLQKITPNTDLFIREPYKSLCTQDTK